mgnify:FL=1|jgi:ATP-dependent Clp protease protease subunit
MQNIQKDSVNGMTEYSIESEFTKKRTIFIVGEINNETLNKFTMTFLYLLNEKQPINIYINSTGGDVLAGLAIYDLIQASDCKINIYCLGMAYSIAAIIFAGCTERYMYNHSKIMIHQPSIGQLKGSASQIEEISNNLLEVKEIIDNIISKHTGQTLEKVKKITEKDSYFNAEEAINFGLADKIITNIII